MSETLGFIGLGNMGDPIAANLIKAGYSVRVYNRTRSKAEPLVQKGATSAPTSADVAAPGGIVFTMLADDAAVEGVCLPAGSFVERLGPGGIHVSLSTISPATARRLAEHHQKYQVEYVASPIFGRPPAVVARTAWFCISGSVAAKSRVKPILEATSQAIFDFGDEPGGANVVKLCGNFLIASAMESLAEVFALARKNGIDPNSVADFFGKTLFACPIYQTYGKLINSRQYEPAGFRLVLGLKDINLALQTAASSAVPMPVASLLRDRWLTGVAKGRGDMDWSVIALGVAEDAGLD
jgi:3-hydroxyisobutyrate dehydrogenase-like beta-hydroxyacid dehydrogenase